MSSVILARETVTGQVDERIVQVNISPKLGRFHDRSSPSLFLVICEGCRMRSSNASRSAGTAAQHDAREVDERQDKARSNNREAIRPKKV